MHVRIAAGKLYRQSQPRARVHPPVSRGSDALSAAKILTNVGGYEPDAVSACLHNNTNLTGLLYALVLVSLAPLLDAGKVSNDGQPLESFTSADLRLLVPRRADEYLWFNPLGTMGNCFTLVGHAFEMREARTSSSGPGKWRGGSKSSGSSSAEPGPRPVRTGTGRGQNNKNRGPGSSLAWPSNLELPSTSSSSDLPFDFPYAETPSPAPRPRPEYTEEEIARFRKNRPPHHVHLPPSIMTMPSNPSSTGTVIRRQEWDGPSRVHSCRTLRAEDRPRDPRQNRSDPYH
ncbi:hypothetical protein PpBr36_08761 [Pyricularia pennisetigena]|uniref:hypothetical protein n=1 Tax=Pyricularia pennisetigena TaxID=1578925 RepID=UPI0011529AFB|nr:hypothetical protein PpBr36_08761 [Pyricularia pennisetigena]TLS23903.1 hypothetical protein PpBr36_08761 [Pyricularia pennisetigena]